MAAELEFWRMDESNLRRWVDANPGCVNDRDRNGVTVLYAAVCNRNSLPLTLWLLDEKSADVKRRSRAGHTPLYAACSLDVLNALLDRGADPALVDDEGWSPSHVSCILTEK